MNTIGATTPAQRNDTELRRIALVGEALFLPWVRVVVVAVALPEPELVVVEEKTALMRKLGKKQLTLHLQEPMTAIPVGLSDWNLVLTNGGADLEYTFLAGEERTAIPALLRRISELGIGYKDLNTRQSSLEDIFVSLVSERA